MSFFRQIWAVTAMNIAGLPSRAGASLVTVIGVASVVAVMLSVLGVGEGVMHSILVNDQPDRVIVLSSAATEEMGSFSTADVALIEQAPGIKKTADGKPLVQPQASVVVELENKTGGGTNNVLFRGTGDMGRAMRGATLHIFQGRTFRAGVRELIVGKGAQRLYKNLEVGDEVTLRGTPWKVVGAYEDAGGINENAIIADADTVLAAFGRTAYQSVGVELESPAAFARFKDALVSNPQLQVQVKPLSQYYRDQASQLTG